MIVDVEWQLRVKVGIARSGITEYTTLRGSARGARISRI